MWIESDDDDDGDNKQNKEKTIAFCFEIKIEMGSKDDWNDFCFRLWEIELNQREK